MPIIRTDFSRMITPRRIYAAFLACVGLWCLAIVGAPALHTLGSAGRSAADFLYLAFSHICHQLDARSLHVCGAKLGVCVRCTAIYFSFFAGLILYPFVFDLDSKKFPDTTWLLLGLGPMVIDAVLNDLGIHQSNELSRIVTGSLAGFVLALVTIPLFVEAFTQLSAQISHQGDSYYAGKTQ